MGDNSGLSDVDKFILGSPALFKSGRVRLADSAKDAERLYIYINVQKLVARHIRADWGDSDEFRRLKNIEAIRKKTPIISTFRYKGFRIVITTFQPKNHTMVHSIPD